MNRIKIGAAAVWGGLLSLLGVLAVPVLLLVGCNIIDYATGLMAAPHRTQTIDSYKSFRGIAKKVCMWLLVAVGAVIDALLKYASETVGIALPFTFAVASVVSIWLVCNELLSILENIGDIGVKMPHFLLKVTKYIKHQTEAKSTIIDEEAGDE